MRLLLASLLFALLTTPVKAKVTSSSPSAFIVSEEVDVAATPTAVWAVLIQPGQWWDMAHSWSHDGRNLTLDARPGGCFCEAVASGGGLADGGVEHMRVIAALPGKLLRMTGALGPMQSEAVVGVLTVTLTAQGQGTHMVWEYGVSGFARMDGQQLALAVDPVLGEQMARLASYATLKRINEAKR